MRIEGLTQRSGHLKRFRESRSQFDRTSVRPSQVQAFEALGWESITAGRTRVRLQRRRPLPEAVELQAWRVTYMCGFSILSGDGGAKLIRAEGVENQLDVVACDEDSALVIECKSSESGVCNIDVQAELAVLNEHRNCVRQILNASRPRNDKLKVGGILVLHNVPFTEADRKRAAEMKLSIFQDSVLQYYERLAMLIGSAARFQLFGEVFQDQEVPGLSLKLPAVEFELGGNKAYSFAIHPDDLLKISFVAHRGRADFHTYQRMVSKKRLRDIARFIDEDGIFPTNIVINFQRPGPRTRLRFDAGSQDQGATPGSRLGYLTVPATYQAAWIIDGQHRLLAYSDHRRAPTASLTVTAFDGLGADKQAELFEKINSKQKKVSANLLAELFATLHWESRDPKLQVRAIASQVAQDLRSLTSSPLYKRILIPDEKSTTLRCITLTELVTGLQRPGLFVRSEDHGMIRQYGVLWAGGADATCRRAVSIVAAWLGVIRDSCPEMWAAGNDDTTGLVATNRGVNACLRVLSWVLGYIRTRQPDIDVASDEQVIEALAPFAQLIGGYFNDLSTDQVSTIRRRYGAGAPGEIANGIGKTIRDAHPDFEPEGLVQWIETKRNVDVDDAQRLCTNIERRLIGTITAKLKEEFGEDGWWREIPLTIRQDAAARREEEPEEPPEAFLFLIDLRAIINSKWQLFQQTLSIGTGSKADKTSWLVKLNEIRRRIYHTGGVRLKIEDVEALRELDSVLSQRGV